MASCEGLSFRKKAGLADVQSDVFQLLVHSAAFSIDQQLRRCSFGIRSRVSFACTVYRVAQQIHNGSIKIRIE